MANSIKPPIIDEAIDDIELVKTFQQFGTSAQFVPVMICGVSRLANLGGFENVNLLSAVSVPIYYDISSEDYLAFRKAAEEAAKIGFAITSKETFDRYTLIKNNQAGGRPAS